MHLAFFVRLSSNLILHLYRWISCATFRTTDADVLNRVPATRPFSPTWGQNSPAKKREVEQDLHGA